MKKLNLTIVGHGRVGGSLTAAAGPAGIEITSNADAVLLCVPDAAIENACHDLGDEPPGLVGHVSGACTLDSLSHARQRGAKVFSLHPLQTFPGPDTPIEGTPCAVAGSDPEAVEYAEELARKFGMRPFEVPEYSRAAYHAAASIASNFLIAIEQAATELLDRAGIGDGREMLSPLVLRTAANWSDSGAGALTGPIARGDTETTAVHREAIQRTWPEILGLYDQLAELTAQVAETERVKGS